MDFVAINGARSYVVTSRSGDHILYHMTEISVLFRHALGYGLMAVLMYILIFITLYLFLMFGYTEQEVERLSRIGTPAEEDLQENESAGRRKRFLKISGNWLMDPKEWKDLNPERKTGIVFRCAMCVLLFLFLVIRSIPITEDKNSVSLFEYILNGDWMRGVNLFSLCAVMLVILGAFLFLSICRALLQLLCRLLDSKGETISRLLYNLIEYVMVFATIYQVFSYLGFPTGTVLASLGLATLALSLGAQGLVADILAGIAIVFEGEFQVGDIVEIDGFEGYIQEIGVRTTKIRNLGYDVKIVENSNIRNVVNKTRFTSWVTADITIPCSESLERVEALLKDELPEIGKKNHQIVSGPNYLGVNGLSTQSVIPHESTMTLRFSTECRQQDANPVRRYVNRELILLCERHGIRIC